MNAEEFKLLVEIEMRVKDVMATSAIEGERLNEWEVREAVERRIRARDQADRELAKEMEAAALKGEKTDAWAFANGVMGADEANKKLGFEKVSRLRSSRWRRYMGPLT